MSVKEFNQWQAYYNIEPFGQERDNYHTAILAQIGNRFLSNTNYKLADFMYKDTKTAKEAESQKVVDALFALSKEK